MEQKKRQKKKNRIIKNNQFLASVLIGSALIQIIYHSLLSGVIGDIGMGYYGITINWILLMIAVASMGIPYIISDLLSARMMRNQTKNAVKMFEVIVISVIIVTTILMVLSILFAEQISFFLLHESILAFGIRVGMPFVFLYSLIQLLRGYFQSFGTDVPTGFSIVIEQFFFLAVSLFISAFMYGKGQKIGKFLHNENYAFLYGSVGAIAGMYAGLILCLLFLLVLFIQHFKGIKRQAAKDTSVRIEGTGVLIRYFSLSYLPLLLICFVVLFSKALDLVMFQNIMEKRGILLDATKQWGLYTTKYQVLLLLPFTCIVSLALSYVKSVVNAYVKNDSSEMRRKISALLRRSVRIFLLFSAVYAVLANIIIKMLFKGDIITATTLLRSGALMPFLMSIALITAYILYETGYGNIVVATTCISAVVQVLSFVFCLNIGKMHIQGLVIADVIAMTVYAIANIVMIQKLLKYRVAYFKTFVMPFVSSVLAAVVMILLRLLFGNLPAIFCFVICTLIGSIVYIVCLIVLKAVGEEELYDLPYGDVLVSIAKMCHIL